MAYLRPLSTGGQILDCGGRGGFLRPRVFYLPATLCSRWAFSGCIFYALGRRDLELTFAGPLSQSTARLVGCERVRIHPNTPRILLVCRPEAGLSCGQALAFRVACYGEHSSASVDVVKFLLENMNEANEEKRTANTHPGATNPFAKASAI